MDDSGKYRHLMLVKKILISPKRRLSLLGIFFCCPLLLFGLLTCSLWKKQHLEHGSLPILQGFTTATIAQFSIVSPSFEKDMQIVAKEGRNNIPLKLIGKMSKEGTTVSQWEAQGLKPKTKYKLLIKSPSGRFLDHRYFESLNINFTHPKIAVVSCMDDGYEKLQRDIWRSLIKQRPDMIFMIGDNVYADKLTGKMWGPRNKPVSPSHLWKRYLDARNTLEIFRTIHLIPTLAVWDDHDYGWNNGDKTYQYKEESKKIFKAFYAQKPHGKSSLKTPPTLELGPGVSLVLRAFHLRFFFLDNRSFRDPPGKGSHWGSEQEKWLLTQLHRKGNTQGNVIINGDQLFGAYQPFESFEGHRKESFDSMMRKIFNSPKPSLFVSGDRHLFEFMKIPKEEFGYTTYELTSSGIHANVFPSPWKNSPNPRQIKGIANIHTYTLLYLNTQSHSRVVRLPVPPRTHSHDHSHTYSEKNKSSVDLGSFLDPGFSFRVQVLDLNSRILFSSQELQITKNKIKK